jgi:hypothetical protein
MLSFDLNLVKHLRLLNEDVDFKFAMGDTVKTKDGKMGKVESSRRAGIKSILVAIAGRGTYDQDTLEIVRKAGEKIV